jgi:hypothetical protein
MKATWFLLPRNPLNGAFVAFVAFVALVAVGLLIGCNKNPAGTRAGSHAKSMPSGSSSSPEPVGRVPLTPKIVAESLRKGRAAGGSKECFREFGANLLLLAEQEGVAPMTLAARLVLDAGSPDDQELTEFIVQITFDDTTSQVELAKALPAGKLRTRATGILGAQLVAAGDLQGLRDVYHALPVGKDRSMTAQRAAKLTMNQLGLSEALDFVASLEMPEERYAAFYATQEQWKTHWNDEGMAAKVNAVIESFDENGRRLLSPMIRKID